MADVIRAVRWRLQFPIGYRDLKRMLADRGWIIRPCRAGRGARRLGVGSKSLSAALVGGNRGAGELGARSRARCSPAPLPRRHPSQGRAIIDGCPMGR
jgi:hypothetical protein